MNRDTEKEFHLHLVSDATGETLETMAKAALVQFEDVNVVKHFWPMIRSARQMSRILEDIAERPGLVMYTLVNSEIRGTLTDGCKKLGLPVISVLDPVIDGLGKFLGREAQRLPGRQYVMDSRYFERIDALQYSMAHDDGQQTEDISRADIILVGVSRTSKTPTSIYLANRGIRAANVPFVPGCPMPAELDNVGHAFVVGLTATPERLTQVRTNRLRAINETPDTAYVDPEIIRDEVAACRRFCQERGWPVIDVTRRSIEETAAAIMALFQSYQEELGKKA